jgi:predicted  nucleic acid-binding Zn-ribbon protein
MGQSFKEVAHLKTDLKKLHENWDNIDWSVKLKKMTTKEEREDLNIAFDELIKDQELGVKITQDNINGI